MQSSASVSKMCLWLVFFKFFWKMYFGLLKHLILRGYTEKRIVRFLSEKKKKNPFLILPGRVRSSYQRCYVKKVFWGLQFIKKETLTQVFSCEFCEIFKNTFFCRSPPVAPSEVFEKSNFSIQLQAISVFTQCRQQN